MPRKPLLRLAASLRYYAAGLYRRLDREPVPVWAQAVAFKVLTTIVPIILIATGIFGLVLRQPNPWANVATFLRSFLPPGQSEPLIELLLTLQQASSTLTVVGIATLVVLVVTLFSILRMVVSMAMGRDHQAHRNLLSAYFFDARMAVQVSLLFLLSFSLTLGVSAVNSIGFEVLADWGLDPTVLRYGERLFLRVAAIVVPFLLSLAMFAQLFYYIPRPRPPVRSAFVGAFITAVLFDIAKTAFTLYATYSGRFERFTTGEEAVSSVFGVLIAFVVWVYFSGLVLIVGAMIVALHEARHRRRLPPTRTPWGTRWWHRVGRRRNAPPAETEAAHEVPLRAGEPEGGQSDRDASAAAPRPGTGRSPRDAPAASQ